MSTFRTEMEHLLARLTRAEHEFDLLNRFKAEDGHRRMRMVVDHHNPEMAAVVSDHANTNMPTTKVLDMLIKAAGQRVAAAKDAITSAAVAESIGGEA